MARLKFGALVSQMSGSIGGSTLQRSSFGHSIRSKPLPIHSRKPLQLIRRNWMSEIQSAWTNLSELQRNLWRQFVAYSGQKINNDSAVLISGYNLFLKYQFCRKLCNFPLLEEFTYIPIPQWPQAFIFANVANQLYIQFDRPIEENTYYFILSVSNPRIPSRGFSPQNCRFMFCTQTAPDIFLFTPDYVSNFGTPCQTGDTIHFTIYYFSLLAPLISGFSSGKAIIGAQFPSQVNPITPTFPVPFYPSNYLGLISPGGISFGNGVFCIFSYYTLGFNISISSNGLDWSPSSIGETMQLTSIGFSGSYFVLTGPSGNNFSTFFSYNGLTWTKYPFSLPGSPGPIVSNGSLTLIFIFSYPRTIIYSASFFNDLSSIGIVNLRLNRSGAFGNGVFVLIETSGLFDRFAYSSNGVNWSVSDPQFEGFFDSVTFGAGRFCAVNLASAGPASITSTDGINWSPSNQNFEGDIVAVSFGNGLFIGVSGGSGNNLIYQSTDGLNWVSYPFSSDIWCRDIHFGSSNFVFISDVGSPAYYSFNA